MLLLLLLLAGLLLQRKVIRKFLLHKFAYCDSPGKAELSSGALAMGAATMAVETDEHMGMQYSWDC